MWITSIVMLITSHMSIFTTQAHHLKDDISLLVLFIRNKLVSHIIVQRDYIKMISRGVIYFRALAMDYDISIKSVKLVQH